MKTLFNNQLGFSLIQGMIIAAVVAGSALVTTRMLTDQKLVQKGSETRDQIEDLNNVIYSVLQSRLNCEQTMVANGLQLTLKTSVVDHPLASINTKDAIVAQTSSFYMNNNVQIDSMVLKAPVGGVRNLEITYERLNSAERTKVGYGAKSIKKIISLRIQKEPSNGDFSSCYAITAPKTNLNGTASREIGNDISKQICEEMNVPTPAGSQTVFIWDEANSICRPNAACPANQIYTGFDNTGTVKCRNIEDWMDFNDIIDPTAPVCAPGTTVRFQIDTVSKVVRIVCS
jgi:hypothetical protein